MTIEKININELKMNPNNPRVIKDDKFKKLVKSIKDFPEMLEVRPIVVDDDMIVLGGNMRLKACQSAGLKEVYIIKFSQLTEDKKKEFIVKDNVGYGEWDFDVLLQDWNKDTLLDWGLDIVEKNDDSINPYTSKIEKPIYEIKNENPNINDVYDINKYNELIEDINKSNLSDDEKDFLRLASTRHIVFNYEKIAELYACSSKEFQELMEDNALIIIDFNKAIELGYIQLNDFITKNYEIDYGK